MIYFQNRAHAGRLLAEELVEKYHHQSCSVVALNPGGVVVGDVIARILDADLSLLLTEPIEIPGVNKETIGMVNQRGDFVYNDRIPTGIIEELEIEFRGVIEQQKLEKMHKIHQLLSEEGIVSPDAIKGKNIIIVSDGLNTGASFDAIAAYLKPIKIKRMVAAVPLATVGSIDRLHILCDEIHVLDVVTDTFKINHYFEEDDDLSRSKIIKLLRRASSHISH